MTSSRFKFLRRVRIHGGECGAVARALHHEAQKSASSQVELLLISDECSSLRQAEPKKAFGSTFIERKQMSTKTSIKRMSLVAVSALGFGLLSVVPAKAANITGFTLGTPTVNVAVEDTLTTISVAGTIPATTADGQSQDVSLNLVSSPSGSSNTATGFTAASSTAAITTFAGGTGTVTGSNTANRTNWAVSAAATSVAGSVTSVFTFTPDTAGSYTVAAFLDTNANGVLDSGETVRYLSFNVVTAPAATVTLTQQIAGTGATYDAASASDGLVVRVGVLNAAGTLSRLAATQQVLLTIPSGLTLRAVSGGSVTATGLSVTNSDYGLAWNNFSASGYAYLNLTGAAATTYTLSGVIGGLSSPASIGLTYATPTAVIGACNNGAYLNADGNAVAGALELPATTGYNSGVSAATVSSAATSTTFRICAAAGEVSKIAQIELTDTHSRVFGGPAGLTQDMVVTLGATTGTSAGSGASGLATATFSVAHSALSRNASGVFRSFEVAGLTAVGTDPSTINNVVTGATASISATGSYQEITPAATVRAVNGSTLTFTATYYDQFGAAVVGAPVTASVSGRNTSAAATNLVTNASGSVSFTVTDGAPTSTTTTDTVSFTGGATAATATISYVAALSASTLTMSPVTTVSAPSSSTIHTATATASTGAVTITATARDANGVAIAGLPIVGTLPAGLSLTATSTATAYTNASGVASWGVFATKEGDYKVTVAGGGLTRDVFLRFTGGTPRVVSVTTGTASGDVTPVTIKVADAYGNGVSGASVVISGTGTGYFQGLALSSTQTTATDGTVRAIWIGSGTVTATITGNQSADTAGFVGTTAAAGFPAGVASASATIAAGTSAAESATDAALEAIDAANAATDAANLAAEAADAATVAAEEARDAADAATAAVEALASEVATLIAGLKAQITTLANTVAKIAKRVRA